MRLLAFVVLLPHLIRTGKCPSRAAVEQAMVEFEPQWQRRRVLVWRKSNNLLSQIGEPTVRRGASTDSHIPDLCTGAK